MRSLDNRPRHTLLLALPHLTSHTSELWTSVHVAVTSDAALRRPARQLVLYWAEKFPMDFEDETASEARTRALEALCEPGKGSSCSRGSFNSQFNSVASRALGRYLSHHSRPEFTLWPFPLDTGKDAKSKLQRSEKLNDFFGAVAALGCKERDVAMEMSLVAEIRATSMHPRDYVRDRYTRKGIHRNQSRITEKYCNFITTTVVTAQDAADRERTMRSWVKVAYFCFKLRNFMTTVEILTALSVAPVRRLPDTHRVYELPRFKKMQKTMAYSSNYKCYRMYLREKTENRAFVPYFGLIFKDIYGIEVRCDLFFLYLTLLCSALTVY